MAVLVSTSPPWHAGQSCQMLITAQGQTRDGGVEGDWRFGQFRFHRFLFLACRTDYY